MNYQQEALEHLERIERKYNVFKAILIVISTIIIIITILYTSNRLYENSNKNRELLRCTVENITVPEQTEEKFRVNLNKCLEVTK